MLQRLSKLITICFTIIFTTLFILLLGIRILGFTPYTILSSSMLPDYEVGSMIYVKSIPQEDLKIGDNITFNLEDSEIIVTHQIVEISDNNEYYTKGLANDTRDANLVNYENLIGKVYFNIPYLGYIGLFITSSKGMIILISFILIWIISLYLMDEKKEEKHEK